MIVESLVLGVAASLVASVVWFVALKLFRPKVEIAPKACFSEGDELLSVKAINRSRRAVVGVRVEIAVIRQIRVAGGMVGRRQVLPLLSPEPLAIEGYRRNNDDRNAYRFRVKIAKEDLLYGGASLRIGIYCRDEISGLGKLFQHSYYDHSEIVIGSYAKGQDFTTIPKASGN